MMRGRKYAFCSSLPWAMIAGPTMPSPIPLVIRGNSARWNSSLRSATSTPLRPRPPYSFGQATHMNPSSASRSVHPSTSRLTSPLVRYRGRRRPLSSDGALASSHSRTSSWNACAESLSSTGASGAFVSVVIASPPLEHPLPLLQERARRFPRVLGAPTAHMPLGLAVELFGKPGLERVVEVRHDRLQRQRSETRKPGCLLAHECHQLGVGHNRADKSDPRRLSGVELLGQKVELPRLRRPDDARQSPGAAKVAGEPGGHERRVELRRHGGVAQVAGAGPGEPRTGAEAVDRRDRDLGHLVKDFGRRHRGAQAGDARLQRGRLLTTDRGAHAAQIAAGAEGATRAGEDHGADGIVSRSLFHGLQRHGDELATHGVEVVGTGECDGLDRVRDLVNDVSGCDHANLGGRFSRKAVTPSRASGWWSVTAVRAAMSSNACRSGISAAL